MSHYEVLKDFAAPVVAFVGLVITLFLGLAGLRTFGKWKREQIEERKIETAIEALALAYESKYVFDYIRSPFATEAEWADMKRQEGEAEQKRLERGALYAVGKRFQNRREFFERGFRLEPRCMAVFGKEAGDIFALMHVARRDIEVSRDTLLWRLENYEPGERDGNDEFYAQCRRDIWTMKGKEPDRVEAKLNEFLKRMEDMFRPVVDHELKRQS